MSTIFMVIAVIAMVGILVATPPTPAGCEDDHVPFRQVVAAIFGVGAGRPEAIDSGGYVALSLIGVAFPVLVLRNAELLVKRTRGERAAGYVRWLSYALAPAAGYLAAIAC